MKKMLGLMIVIILASMAFAGCSKEDKQEIKKETKQETMVIKPGQLSKESDIILKAFVGEAMIYDYIVDESATYITHSLWIYREGEWVRSGASASIEDSSEGRIGIRLTESECDIVNFDETGYAKSSFDGLEKDLSETTMKVGWQLSNPTPIKLNEEILLSITLGTNSNSYSIGSKENFRDYECEEGIAVTVTFSDHQDV